MGPPMTAADRARRLLRRVALVGWICAWSGEAWALCPNCLGQRPTLTPTLWLVGLFLLVPFAVVTVVCLVLRRAIYGRARPPSSPAPPSPPVLPSPAPPSSGGGVQTG
jgi:hypothetical protein